MTTPTVSDPIGRAFEEYSTRVDALERELDRLYEARGRSGQREGARDGLVSIERAIEKVRAELLMASGDVGVRESCAAPRSGSSSGTLVVEAARPKARRFVGVAVAFVISLGAFVWVGGLVS